MNMSYRVLLFAFFCLSVRICVSDQGRGDILLSLTKCKEPVAADPDLVAKNKKLRPTKVITYFRGSGTLVHIIS